jgi:hypothetical protein
MEHKKDFVKLCPLLYNKIRPNRIFFDSGWDNLVKDVSIKIEKIIEKMPEEVQSNFYATQIKEKFGSLRFYMSNSTEEIDQLIKEAERKSVEICECCSRPGTIKPSPWLKCLCESCRK